MNGPTAGAGATATASSSSISAAAPPAKNTVSSNSSIKPVTSESSSKGGNVGNISGTGVGGSNTEVAAGEVNGVDDAVSVSDAVDGEDSVSSAANGKRYLTVGDATVDATVVTFTAVDAATTDSAIDDDVEVVTNVFGFDDDVDDVSKAYCSARFAPRVHFAGGSRNGSLFGGLGGRPSDMNFQRRVGRFINRRDQTHTIRLFSRFATNVHNESQDAKTTSIRKVER